MLLQPIFLCLPSTTPYLSVNLYHLLFLSPLCNTRFLFVFLSTTPYFFALSLPLAVSSTPQPPPPPNISLPFLYHPRFTSPSTTEYFFALSLSPSIYPPLHHPIFLCPFSITLDLPPPPPPNISLPFLYHPRFTPPLHHPIFLCSFSITLDLPPPPPPPNISLPFLYHPRFTSPSTTQYFFALSLSPSIYPPLHHPIFLCPFSITLDLPPPPPPNISLPFLYHPRFTPPPPLHHPIFLCPFSITLDLPPSPPPNISLPFLYHPRFTPLSTTQYFFALSLSPSIYPLPLHHPIFLCPFSITLDLPPPPPPNISLPFLYHPRFTPSPSTTQYFFALSLSPSIYPPPPPPNISLPFLYHPRFTPPLHHPIFLCSFSITLDLPPSPPPNISLPFLYHPRFTSPSTTQYFFALSLSPSIYPPLHHPLFLCPFSITLDLPPLSTTQYFFALSLSPSIYPPPSTTQYFFALSLSPSIYPPLHHPIFLCPFSITLDLPPSPPPNISLPFLYHPGFTPPLHHPIFLCPFSITLDLPPSPPPNISLPFLYHPRFTSPSTTQYFFALSLSPSIYPPLHHPIFLCPFSITLDLPPSPPPNISLPFLYHPRFTPSPSTTQYFFALSLSPSIYPPPLHHPIFLCPFSITLDLPPPPLHHPIFLCSFSITLDLPPSPPPNISLPFLYHPRFTSPSTTQYFFALSLSPSIYPPLHHPLFLCPFSITLDLPPPLHHPIFLCSFSITLDLPPSPPPNISLPFLYHPRFTSPSTTQYFFALSLSPSIYPPLHHPIFLCPFSITLDLPPSPPPNISLPFLYHPGFTPPPSTTQYFFALSLSPWIYPPLHHPIFLCPFSITLDLPPPPPPNISLPFLYHPRFTPLSTTQYFFALSLSPWIYPPLHHPLFLCPFSITLDLPPPLHHPIFLCSFSITLDLPPSPPPNISLPFLYHPRFTSPSTTQYFFALSLSPSIYPPLHHPIFLCPFSITLDLPPSPPPNISLPFLYHPGFTPPPLHHPIFLCPFSITLDLPPSPPPNISLPFLYHPRFTSPSTTQYFFALSLSPSIYPPLHHPIFLCPFSITLDLPPSPPPNISLPFLYHPRFTPPSTTQYFFALSLSPSIYPPLHHPLFLCTISTTLCGSALSTTPYFFAPSTTPYFLAPSTSSYFSPFTTLFFCPLPHISLPPPLPMFLPLHYPIFFSPPLYFFAPPPSPVLHNIFLLSLCIHFFYGPLRHLIFLFPFSTTIFLCPHPLQHPILLSLRSLHYPLFVCSPSTIPYFFAISPPSVTSSSPFPHPPHHISLPSVCHPLFLSPPPPPLSKPHISLPSLYHPLFLCHPHPLHHPHICLPFLYHQQCLGFPLHHSISL